MKCCNCIGITSFGNYENQVELKSPKWSSHKTICIDKCLEEEIKLLWSFGIITHGSCCGHNIGEPMINVADCSIANMESLGYIHRVSGNKDQNRFTFKPKSIWKELSWTGKTNLKMETNTKQETSENE